MPSCPDNRRKPSRLNICVIGSTYPRHEGDYAVPWLRESVRRLTNRGHRVTVLAPSYEGMKSHEIDGVSVNRFRYAPKGYENLTHEQGAPNKLKNPFKQVLGLPYVAMGSLAAARLAVTEGFDVIHSHWPFPHGAIAAAARLAGGAPVVTNCHGAEFALARRKKWVRPLLRWALVGSDRIICNSAHTAGEVKGLSGCDSAVVPYGTTVLGRPSPLPRNEVSRILFTGRLIQRKGVEYLIRAMPEILKSRKAVLEITGGGDQKERLEALAKELNLGDAVKFYGFVDQDTLDSLYASCDVYINPSVIDDNGDTEGLGVGPIEAFCHGRPVVACGVGGIVDVVKHNHTGLLVPEKNPSALAASILEILNDPARAETLAASGLAYAQQHFCWERITDSLEDIYRAAIAERGRSKAGRRRLVGLSNG